MKKFGSMYDCPQLHKTWRKTPCFKAAVQKDSSLECCFSAPQAKRKRSWFLGAKSKNADSNFTYQQVKEIKETAQRSIGWQLSAFCTRSQLVWISCCFQFDVTWETKLPLVLTAVWTRHLYLKGRGFVKDAGFLTLQDTYQTTPRALV